MATRKPRGRVAAVPRATETKQGGDSKPMPQGGSKPSKTLGHKPHPKPRQPGEAKEFTPERNRTIGVRIEP